MSSTISLSEFVHLHEGSSVLYRPSPAREVYRGQCLQLVCLYAEQVVGSPVMYHEYAYNWFTSFSLDAWYTRIGGSEDMQPGDIVIWSPLLPGSGGMGHIAIYIQAVNSKQFLSYESNWGGKTAHYVTHNKDYILGILRPRPKVIPKTEDEPVIQNTDPEWWQWSKLYKQVRPNEPSRQEFEIYGVGKNWKQAVEAISSGPEAEKAMYLQNLGKQVQGENWQGQFKVMQDRINELNQVVTDLNSQKQITAVQLKEALGKIGNATAQMETAHDTVTDLQKPTVAEPAKASWIVRLLAGLTKKQ